MTHQGTVIFVSANGAMLAVQHDDGYALVELIGDEGAIARGAQVLGEWNVVESEPIYCDGRRYDAYFQGNWPGREVPLNLARNTG